MDRATISTVQFVAIVAACALVGYSLSRFPGAATVPWWLSTLIGAGMGMLAFAVSPFFSSLARRTERDSSPRMKLGFKLMFVGGVIALCGLLVAVLVPSTLGNIIFFGGWLLGVAGIVLYRGAKCAA